jgi:multidrug efflux pump subunit AcrA (membrane-fusion protein)
MTTTIQEPPSQTPPAPESDRRPAGRRRRMLVATAAAAVVAAVGVAVTVTDPLAGSRMASTRVRDNGVPTGLATVRQGPLSSQVNASGTLDYGAQPDGSPYQVLNQASGAFTKLPSGGQVVACGQVLYRVDDNPVVLLCGSTPAYRSLFEGDSGPDVQELNANLVHLGYAARSQLDPSSDYFSSETAYALEQLQAKLGVDQTGSLSLGQAVFLPGPIRISKTTAALGSMARPGSPVADATSTHRQVEVNLNASQQTGVKAGEEAHVTLPNNSITPGTVTRIGTIASSSGAGQDNSSSGSNNATIPVYITLKHPGAAGSLDQAPVQVQIKTAGVNDALIVPINALLAEAGGGYAVETVDSRGAHHLVPVTVGLFDDADGLVQVTGALTAGSRVVVPST